MWMLFARECGWTLDYCASLPHSVQMLAYAALLDELRGERQGVKKFKHPRTGRDTLRFTDPAQAREYIRSVRGGR